MLQKIKKIVIPIAVLIISVVFYQCQNDEGLSNSDNNSLASPKKWFEDYEAKGENYPAFQKLDYDWKSATAETANDGTEMFIVPVLEKRKEQAEIWEQKLYIYKIDKDTYKALLYEFYPEKQENADIEGNFSGYIVAWDLKKGFVKAAKFLNDKIVENGVAEILSNDELARQKTTARVPAESNFESETVGEISLRPVLVQNNYIDNTYAWEAVYYGRRGRDIMYGNYDDYTGSYSGSSGGGNNNNQPHTDPCEQMRALTDVTKTGNMKPSVDWLKGKVMAAVNKVEHGIEVKKVMNPDGTYRYEYTQVSSVDEFSVPLSTGSSYIGGAHSHPKNGYAMFSFGDVKFLRNAYDEASPSRKQDVFCIMVAKDNSGNVNAYAIKVDDFATLDRKVNEVWNNPKYNAYTEIDKLDLIHTDQAYKYHNSKGALEESFLQQFGSFGISIYKADDALKQWNKLTLNTATNRVTQTPCN